MNGWILMAVSDYVGWEPEVTLAVVNKAPHNYRRYAIPKKKGGTRFIYHPAKETKAIQYALMELILSDIPVHEVAAAYRKGTSSPLLKNAKLHSRYSYSIRVDLKDFFPSIQAEDLLQVLRQEYNGKDRILYQEDEDFLKKALFILLPGGKFGLAIGAPSSPMISNIVMYSIDEKLSHFALSSKGVLSRYADDFVYSCNQKGGCLGFMKTLEKQLNETISPKLNINRDKTLYTSRGTRRAITGLYVTPNGEVSIGRKNKRYVKKLIFDYKNSRLDAERKKYLKGYLSFVEDVEPEFLNRLIIKYGGEVVRNAHKGI